jgi:AbrB family looped-hinge helix DNA binding protein
MEQVFATVSSKGQLVIPAQFREAMGIEAGTRVAIRQEGSQLVLQPQTKDATRLVIERLCGSTAGGFSMSDALIEERHAEDAKAGW